MAIPENEGPYPNTVTNPQLRYTSEGRGGTIHYASAEASFDTWYEMAGSNAIAIIAVPAPRHWEVQTQTALSQRARILQFIGEQGLNDQVKGDGYFLTDDNFITIYSGRNPVS